MLISIFFSFAVTYEYTIHFGNKISNQQNEKETILSISANPVRGRFQKFDEFLSKMILISKEFNEVENGKKKSDYIDDCNEFEVEAFLVKYFIHRVKEDESSLKSEIELFSGFTYDYYVFFRELTSDIDLQLIPEEKWKVFLDSLSGPQDLLQMCLRAQNFFDHFAFHQLVILDKIVKNLKWLQNLENSNEWYEFLKKIHIRNCIFTLNDEKISKSDYRIDMKEYMSLSLPFTDINANFLRDIPERLFISLDVAEKCLSNEISFPYVLYLWIEVPQLHKYVDNNDTLCHHFDTDSFLFDIKYNARKICPFLIKVKLVNLKGSEIAKVDLRIRQRFNNTGLTSPANIGSFGTEEIALLIADGSKTNKFFVRNRKIRRDLFLSISKVSSDMISIVFSECDFSEFLPSAISACAQDFRNKRFLSIIFENCIVDPKIHSNIIRPFKKYFNVQDVRINDK